jgi:hypothetical protein
LLLLLMATTGRAARVRSDAISLRSRLVKRGLVLTFLRADITPGLCWCIATGGLFLPGPALPAWPAWWRCRPVTCRSGDVRVSRRVCLRMTVTAGGCWCGRARSGHGPWLTGRALSR